MQNLPHPSQGSAYMQKIMKAFGKSVPLLDQMDYLETTDAFQEARRYLEKKDVIREFPTIEINSKVYDEMPSFSMLHREIQQMIKKEAPSI